MAMNDPYNYSDNQGNFKYANARNDQMQNYQQKGKTMPAPSTATTPLAANQRNMQPHATVPLEGATVPMNQRNMQPQTQTPAPVAGTTTQQAPPASCMPTTLDCPYYTAGVLRRYIGELVRVEFLIGSTAPLVDRTGTLLEVGASYIIISPSDAPNNVEICDLYSIKFVNVIRLR